MDTVTTILKSLLVCWLVLLVSACSGGDSRPLKVATNLWVGYEPLYLAQYLGAYARQVEVIQLSSSTEVMRAMAHGSVDVAALTLDEAILLMSKGLDVVPVRILDQSQGADAVLTYSDYRSTLHGMKVGVENTALGAIVLSEALVQSGIKPDEIDIVNVSADEQERALQSGRVNAVVTFEPIKSRLLAKGARVLFDTSQAPDLVLDVLVVRREVLEHNSARLEHLLQGYLTARSYMLSHQSEANAFFSKRLGLYPEQLQQAFAGITLPSPVSNLEWFSGSPSRYETSFARTLQLMHARNLVQGNPPPNQPPQWVLEVAI